MSCSFTEDVDSHHFVRVRYTIDILSPSSGEQTPPMLQLAPPLASELGDARIQLLQFHVPAYMYDVRYPAL